MLERDYQAKLIRKIEGLLPGSLVLKQDPNYRQGIPDLLVLFRGRWAALEVKVSAKAKKQPNQDYYVNYLNSLSFAAFIFPDNEKAVLDDLQHALRAEREACLPCS